MSSSPVISIDLTVLASTPYKLSSTESIITVRVSYFYTESNTTTLLTLPPYVPSSSLSSSCPSTNINGSDKVSSTALSRTRTLPSKRKQTLDGKANAKDASVQRLRTVKRYFSNHNNNDTDSSNANAATTFETQIQCIASYLHHVKHHVEIQLKQVVREAVLVIPTSSTMLQRQSFISSAKVAGLKITRLMNCTTAIALTRWFGMKKSEEQEEERSKSVLVVMKNKEHWLEVAIVELGEAKIVVLGTFFGDNQDSTRVLNDSQKFIQEKRLSLSEILLVLDLTHDKPKEFQQQLLEIFASTPVTFQPTDCITTGGATLARYLSKLTSSSPSDSRELPPLKLKESTSYKLSIHSSGSPTAHKLPRNSFVPFLSSTSYTTDYDLKTYIRVYIYEGNDINEQNLVGILTVEGLQKKAKGGVQVEVEVGVGTDGIVGVQNVKVISDGSGKDSQFYYEGELCWDFEERGMLTEEDLEKLRKVISIFNTEINKKEKDYEAESDDEMTLSLPSFLNKKRPETLNATSSSAPSSAPSSSPSSSPSSPAPSQSSRRTITRTPTTLRCFTPNQNGPSRTPTLRNQLPRTPFLRQFPISTTTTGKSPMTPQSPSPSTPGGGIGSATLESNYDFDSEYDTSSHELREDLRELLTSMRKITSNRRFRDRVGQSEVSTLMILCDHLSERIEDYNHEEDEEFTIEELIGWRRDFEDLVTPILQRFSEVCFTPKTSSSTLDRFTFEEIYQDTTNDDEKKVKEEVKKVTQRRKSRLMSKRRSSTVVSVDLDDIMEKFNELIY